MIRRIWRRFRQGVYALIAFAIPVDYDAAARVLTPPLMGLFRRMRRSEQLHALRVMKMLEAQGHTNRDLLTAALLHDVGKSRCPFTLPERVMVVLGSHLLPARAARWGDEPCRSWKRAFFVATQHPDWSAEDMLARGASPMAVALACRHQEPLDGDPQNEEDRLLLLLQIADRAN